MEMGRTKGEKALVESGLSNETRDEAAGKNRPEHKSENRVANNEKPPTHSAKEKFGSSNSEVLLASLPKELPSKNDRVKVEGNGKLSLPDQEGLEGSEEESCEEGSKKWIDQVAMLSPGTSKEGCQTATPPKGKQGVEVKGGRELSLPDQKSQGGSTEEPCDGKSKNTTDQAARLPPGTREEVSQTTIPPIEEQ
jgi:hypothetical protein